MTDKPPRDWRSLALGVGAVLVLTVVATVATIGLAAAFDVDFDDLSRDPTSVYKGPVYAGWFSNLVALLWQVPTTCALLATVLLWSSRRSHAVLFLVAGLISGLLAADDLFLWHEFLAETVRLPELVLPVLYGLAVVVFAVVFRRALGTTGIGLVALALLCWTGAVVMVVLTGQHGTVVASAAKLAGVGFWALLVLRLVVTALRAAPADAAEESPAEAPAVEEEAAAKDEADADEQEPAAEPEPEPKPEPEPAAAAAEPAEPATELQKVVPPAPARPNPQDDPVTRPIPVTRMPDDARTVARPVVRMASRPPAEPGRGRRPGPPDQRPPDQRPRRWVEPGPPPLRPGPPPAQPSRPPPPQPSPPSLQSPPPPQSPPPEQPPTEMLPTQAPLQPHPLAAPPAEQPPTELLPSQGPPEPHPLASPPMPAAPPPEPPPARSDDDGPRHRRT